jgi:hypothetical protein
MQFTFTYIVNGLLIYHHYLYVSTNVNKYKGNALICAKIRS